MSIAGLPSITEITNLEPTDAARPLSFICELFERESDYLKKQIESEIKYVSGEGNGGYRCSNRLNGMINGKRYLDKGMKAILFIKEGEDDREKSDRLKLAKLNFMADIFAAVDRPDTICRESGRYLSATARLILAIGEID